MDKKQSNQLILNQIDLNGTAKKVPIVNGVNINTSKPYRRSRKFSRYNNALKNLIPIRFNGKSTGSMPIDSTGLYSTVFGGWLTKYLWKAYRRDGMIMSELPTISPYDCCEYNSQRLEILWNEEVAKHGVEGASFGKVAWRFSRTRIIFACLILSVALILGFLSQILLMRRILEFVESPEGTISDGIKWTLLLSLCEFARILFLTWSWVHNYRTALRFKSAYLGMLYKKVIRTNDFGNKSSGKFINMISNDGQRLFDVCIFGPTLIAGPIVTVCGIIYILCILSPMGLFGMLTFFLFYPIQYGISRLNGYLKSRGVKIADQRISGVNEILDCIKLIKMYAWEEPFRRNLLELRKKEKKQLHKISYARSVGLTLSPVIPVISLIVTFLAHVSGGNNLTAAQAFPIISFFTNQMKQALTSFREATQIYYDCDIAFGRSKVFPLVTLFNTQIRHMFSFVEISISNIIEARISCARFKSVLVIEDRRFNVHKPILKTQALSIVNGTFTCDASTDSFADDLKAGEKLKNKKNKDTATEKSELNESLLPHRRRQEILTEITFEATKGKLIGICGHVGSGKTSLLLAALGQLRLASGQLSRDGTCAYVSQQAWILHATFKDNIIFGEPYDEERYNNAVDLCSLREDLNTFPAADDTEIGERGINLSGGQKQRVALARSLYADRDIYFLDDPLSAVDAQVGAYMFENLIKGALRGKTILFVTHQIQYLSRCDEIYMMNNGKIVEHGVHERLMEANNKYATMVKSMMSEAEEETSNREDCIENENLDKSSLKNSRLKESGNGESDEEGNKKENEVAAGASLIVPENIETGTIKLQTYHTYIQAAGGYFVAFLMIAIFAMNVGSTSFSTWWLAHWIKAGAGGNKSEIKTNVTEIITDNPDLVYYETIYATCIAAILLTSAFRGLVIALATIRASTSLHNRVFMKILQAPVEFFETTPRGRIQNIFSRDTDEIDVHLPITLEGVIQSSLSCIFSLCFVCAVFPWFFVAIFLLGILFYYIGKLFRVALRDLKRFESNTRSPILSFATASVQGLNTIHAFEKETEFVRQFQAYLDVNGACQYLCNVAMRWLSVRYDTLSGIATGTTALFVIFLKGQVPPALAGLAMSYSCQVSGVFQFTMRMFSEIELRFISVERISHYLRTLLNEDDGTKVTTKSLENWPQNGEIEFKNVELRYRQDLPRVLNRISFHIQANEKIGIVGRTGSGKSSIIVALFRIVELSAGSIKIDGIDTSEIDIKRLRRNISIIPQDPVLFNRSLRFNLDPNGDNTDTELWLVLEKIQLKDKVRAMPGQLNAVIDTGGSNLSMGERQLLCLARALLRRNKILVLDEATAAVDPETEAIVQMTIQREFTNCTILTIAHRLQTVLSCDRILVIDASNIVEFDTPSNLLQENSNSEFSRMMSAANTSINYCHRQN